jgi:hypothetical protein
MHFFDPIPKAVQDHPSNDRVIAVERVSGTAEIGVPTFIFFKNVVRLVFKSLEGERGAIFVAFRRVIVDDVEDDLDVSFVKGFHHVAKLVDDLHRVLVFAVGDMRCEK